MVGLVTAADRGQLVLVAAAVLAVALVPLAFAAIQLGYHGDVEAGSERGSPGENAVRLLERAVHEASAAADGHPWAGRGTVPRAVNRSLAPRIHELETARLTEGVAVSATQNASLAAEWADDHCPSGPHRRFGPCQAVGGIVIQERAGETTLLAVAFDIRVTEPRGMTELSVVVEAGGTSTGSRSSG